MPRAIDLLLDEIIPSDLRGNLNDLSGSNVNDFLVDLYKKYPEQYKKISHDLGRLGAKSAYIQGETLGLEDFEPVVDKPLLLAAMNDEIGKAREKFGSSDQFKKARESIWVRYNDMMLKNTISGAKATNNRIGHAVISGARGKNAQMQAMLTTPGLYADSKGDIVPMFVENSFAEGLRPLEFAAGMFGARASVISTKAATAKGGDYGKLLSQASARLLITDKDCGVKNGIAYDIEDNTARNRILARDIGNFKAGTMLTREVLSDLKKNNINKIVARSPLTCNADGLCSQCVGITFENKFPKIGEHVGITAANAVCLEENTEILMADGTVKAIKDIVPGEFVIGVDEQGVAKSSKVLDNYDRGEQHCYEFFYTFLKDMSSIIATKNHRCVVNDSLMPLGEIDEHNSYFTLPKEIHIENFSKLRLLEEVKETYSGRIVNMEYHGFYKTRDLYIEHPNHVFLTKDFIQVHNSEPVTQGALSAKHTGGQATQKGEYGGFPILSQFVQSPTEYVHKAITPDEDGQVSNIEEAPQGGYNVFINNKSYYVKPGYPLTVKVGQQVESGQPLSEGIVDARDVVEKVGLGAGRKYWVDRIQKIYKDSGLYADKKNLEIVARGTLDTVALDEEIDGVDAYMDDVVNYNQIKKAWKPTDAAKKPTDMALNKYLASDTLEHTIGTRVTPSIQKQFQEAGINELDVMDKKPPFSPNMDRLRTASHYNDDWLAGLSTSYLKKQLEDSSLRAATTNIKENQHWAPRIAVGVGFGENIKTTGKF
jgi:DNA-directed RNA polymerase subunit beta'